MSEMPRDSRNYLAEEVPIETVHPGDSLVVDHGQGRQLFQVEEVTFHYTSGVTNYTLTSGPLADGSKPWVEEYKAGETVTRLLGIAP
jgi:hypothetical protein